MKKQLLILGIVAILVSVGFSGCINVPKELTQMSIVSFDVESGIINEGESANLSWVVISASSVNIDNGIGSVALTGHRIIKPTQTTTYILTASNATTTRSASVTINVNKVNNTLNPEKDEFVGTWVNTTYDGNNRLVKTIIFYSNGTAIYGGYPFTWDLKEGKLILSYEGFSETQNYTFSNNNNTLYLASSNLFHFATTYTKQ
jgi:hypothetical protein